MACTLAHIPFSTLHPWTAGSISCMGVDTFVANDCMGMGTSGADSDGVPCTSGELGKPTLP